MLRVADVAREAGVSPGIVHYYFASKEDLIRETFEDSFAASLVRRSSILEKEIPVDQKLEELLGSYVPRDEVTTEAWHVWLELWVAALQDERLRELNDAAYDEWRTMMGSIISEGIEQGVFATEHLESVVNQLIAMIDGLAVQALMGSSVISPKRMLEICADFVHDHLSVH